MIHTHADTVTPDSNDIEIKIDYGKLPDAKQEYFSFVRKKMKLK